MNFEVITGPVHSDEGSDDDTSDGDQRAPSLKRVQREDFLASVCHRGARAISKQSSWVAFGMQQNA